MITVDTISESDVAAISRVREDWVRAMNADDVEGMVAPCVEDFIALPPHEAASIGKEAQRTWHSSRVGQFTTRLTMTSEELRGGGV